ncbi:MAG TPA: hypothetical protein VG097_12825 [Gemmata sp.]|jgi:dCTP deaminase|nr:hypothetical protein [Gemmata sp.]
MFLSDRDIRLALATGQLIVHPVPTEIDTTGIDVHLDKIDEARIWDTTAYADQQARAGHSPVLKVGRFKHKAFAKEFEVPIPRQSEMEHGGLVYRDGETVIIKPGGFFLWQTREMIGTPEIDPRLICFIDGKSTRARTGIVVHMTAPTIHAGWWGQVTLEIANLGPFDLGLCEGDAIAQITVAYISSPPSKHKNVQGVAIGQRNVTGGSNAVMPDEGKLKPGRKQKPKN